MSQARITSTTIEVLTKPEAIGRVSTLTVEVLHSVQEGEPPPPAAAGRRILVIVMA